MGKFGRQNFRGNFRDNRDKQMHDATCADCGRPCQVPFRPTGDKPIYCSNCFRNHRDSGGDRKPNFQKQAPANNQEITGKLKQLEEKLDRILRIVSSAGEVSTSSPKKENQTKVEKTPATKKTAVKKAATKKTTKKSTKAAKAKK